MLYLVGLGLSDETDITVKGLEVVKKSSRIYLEAYTSILLVDQAVLVSLRVAIRSQLSDLGRKNTMSVQLPLPTEKWSNPTATKFCAMRKWRMSRS